MMTKSEVNEHIPAIEALIKSHKTVSAWLGENSPPPRWSEKTMRNTRMDLATGTLRRSSNEMSVCCQNLMAGRLDLTIEEANDMAESFFRRSAFVRLTERATPDRKVIRIGEAFRNWLGASDIRLGRPPRITDSFNRI